MAETIESFVTRLQVEGIEAGQQQARQIVDDARKQAEQIIHEASQQGRQHIDEADRQAQDALARSRSELDLACRDVLLRLRQALQTALADVLRHRLDQTLADPDFLAKTLHYLVVLYAKADIDRQSAMKINVDAQTYHQMAEWAIKEMSQTAHSLGMTLDLAGTLKARGFEYSVDGATVEVTTNSVAELLSDLVSPRLKEIIDTAMAGLAGERAD